MPSGVVLNCQPQTEIERPKAGPLRRCWLAGYRIGYSGSMNANVSIEVDKRTADVLQMRATELGVTVPQLIAELAALDSAPRSG